MTEYYILYTGLNCKACKDVKVLIQTKGISHVEVDISSDPIAKEFLINDLKVRSIPCLVDLEGDVAGIGFDDIKEYLDRMPV